MTDTTSQTMTAAELLGALSYALDITEGQPEGHCLRACWIGMHIGQEIGLSDDELSELYYAVLLKDLGCSSNAARLSTIYLADDRLFKHSYKTIPQGLAATLEFVFSNTGKNADLPARFKAVANILRNGKDISRELIVTRCSRGANIAKELRFSDAVATGIHDLDEHWDGRGQPQGLSGQNISIFARIALLSQVVDVFHTEAGPLDALKEVEARAGSWFDPDLVLALMNVARHRDFWSGLSDPHLPIRVMDLNPAPKNMIVDDDYFDCIARAFGQVIDAKSPYTAGHSVRVEQYSDEVAASLGMSLDQRRWLRRGALLHDVGKLGVSNTILDKPGKLDDDEWQVMREHAVHSEKILSHIKVFKELAFIAGAHHERLDGTGYPRNLVGEDIPLETRIITVADFFDALTADRPYRDAMPVEKALDIIGQEVGKAIDPRCFEALCDAVVPNLKRAEKEVMALTG